MPAAVVIYLCFYGVTVLANSVYCFVGKIDLKISALVYEPLSGLFLVFMAAAYWIPELKAMTGGACATAFLLVLALEVYFTVWGAPEELGISQEDLSDAELDVVKGISLILAGPAYVMGLLLSLELLIPR